MERMSTQEYRRIAQGKLNHAMGAHFEDAIKSACVYYREKKIASIDKNNEPLKPIRSMGGGKFMAVFTEKSQPDFSGILQGGRMVMFEAKHTSMDKIKQDAVKIHQAAYLSEKKSMGAWCFVLVCLENRFYRVPWQDWENMKEICGHKYMNSADITPYKVPYRNGIIEFLEGSERAEAL